jgi:hypothetical protein
MPASRSLVLVFAVAAALLSIPGLALADTTVTGEVTSESGGAVLEGAKVVVIDRNGAGTADDRAVGADVTDSGGDFSIVVETGGGGAEPADGDAVELLVHDAGTQVESQAVTLSGGTVVSNVAATPSGTTFAALDIFGGQVSRVLAGGAPCEFYLATSVIPQVFVTTDCAGTWTPVTGQTDSSGSGLNGDTAINGSNMATSGVEGEVAVIVNGRVQYSRDYGVTWSTVTGTIAGAGNTRELYWGHVVGGADVIVVRDGTSTWNADLSSATPTLITMTSSLVASQYDGIAVGNGATQPYIAIASEASSDSITVTIRPLAAGATPAASSESFSVASGGSGAWPASQPVRVAFGGAARTNWPNVLMLSVLESGSDVVKVLSDVDDNGFSSTVTANRTAGGNCGSNAAEMSIGRGFDPRDSGGTAGLVIAGACYIAFGATGTSPAFDASASSGGNNAAIDSGWGTTAFDGTNTSRVLIAPQGDRGIFKAASVSSSLPVWPSLPATDNGAAGTAPASDGFTVKGLTVPVTKAMTFGPTGATDVAVTFSPSGGGLCIASSDGLATTANTNTVVRKGGYSVAWFAGSGSNDWLLCGHADSTNSLTAVRDWTAATTPASSQVASFASAQHSLTQINAIEGVTGSDVAWFGGPASDVAGDGKAVRGALGGGGGSAVTVGSLQKIALDDPVADLEYCPAGSATGFADVLFIATLTSGGSTTGSVYRLASASTATTGASVTQLTGAGTTGAASIEVNCASGVLYAGFKRGGGSTVVQKSTDGTSLSTLTLAGTNFNQGITAMAINPSSASELVVAADSEGFMYATVDGGTSWTTVNNARQFPGGVNFNSEGISALALPPGLVRSATTLATRQGEFHAKQQRLSALIGTRSVAVSSSSTLVGGGAGAYRSSLRSGLASGGGSGGGGSGGAPTGGGAAPSSGGSSSTPVKATVTTRIAAAKWSAAKRTITANVTVQKAGKVTVTVSLKKGTKLTKVTTGSATVKKAGTSAAVFTVPKRLAKGTYVLTIAGGGTTSLTVR